MPDHDEEISRGLMHYRPVSCEKVQRFKEVTHVLVSFPVNQSKVETVNKFT